MKIGGSEAVQNGKREPKFLSGEQWRVKRREGKGVSDYHEKLAQGIADLVEVNGKEITSVLYYPPAYGESEDELDAEEIAESR